MKKPGYFHPLSIQHSEKGQGNSIHLLLITERWGLGSQLQNYFSRSASLSITHGSIHDIKQTIQTIDYSKESFSIILFDMDLLSVDAIEHLRIIKSKAPTTKIILLVDQKYPNPVHQIINCRISGLLPVDANFALYEKAITAVLKGELWFSRRLVNQMLDVFSNRQVIAINFLANDVNLTDCEKRISELVIQGLTNKQIAQRLLVSPETVKKHLKAIFEKFGVHSRNQLSSVYISLLQVCK